MKTINSFRDAEIALAEVSSKLDTLLSKDIDLHERRIKNASPSKDSADYVIRAELLGQVGSLNVTGLPGPIGPAGPSGEINLPVVDTTEIIKGNLDPSKRIRFELDGLTTGNLRVLTSPDANITIAGINIAQTFSATQTFQHILVSANDTYDLGDSINYFRQLFVGDIQIGNSIAPALGVISAQIAFLNRNNAAQFNLNAEHLDGTTALYASFTGHVIPSSNVTKDFGSIVPAIRRWRAIYAQLGDFKQISGAAVAALVVKNDGSVAAGDVFQVQKTDGTAIFKITNQNDPGVGNAMTSEHHFGRLGDTYDLGGVPNYWRKLYVNEINLSNDKKIFFKDNAGTLISTAWMDATNDFNIGLQAAGAGGGGDLVFWAQGQAFIELNQTAANLAGFEIVAGRVVDFGSQSNPIQTFTGWNLDLYTRGGVGGTIHLYRDDGTQYLSIYYSNGGTGHALKLPANQGAASTFLTNDGAGQLTWGNSFGHILPLANNTYDIGNGVTPLRFRDIYLSNAVNAPRHEIKSAASSAFWYWAAAGDTSVQFKDNAGNNFFGIETSGAGTPYISIAANILPTTDNARNLGTSSLRFATANISTIELGLSAATLGIINFHHSSTAGTAILRSANVTGNVDIETTAAFYPSSDTGVNCGLATRRWGNVYSVKFTGRDATGDRIILDPANFNLDLYDSGGTLEARLSTSAGNGQLALTNAGVEKVFLDGAATPEMRLDGNRVVTTRQSAVTAPTGGGTVDSEARTAINDIISRLKVTGGHGLIAD